MQPAISVVMPVFNRRQIVQRSIQSVQRQTFTDWELIIVDDGSTDGTPDSITTSDARVRVLRQSNRGANAARNLGIRESSGRYIAFLDSDDEWMPHFLALTFEFLERHPHEAFVATEFVQRSRDGTSSIQDAGIIRNSHVPLAARVGSNALDLPDNTTDDYLRIYESWEYLGDWWLRAVDRPDARLPPAIWYRGHIGEAYRWGHLHALWCLLIRRDVVESIGALDETRRSCADFKFLVQLCRMHRANMISVPSVIKHHIHAADTNTAGHLSAGKGYATFCKNYAGVFEELFVTPHPKDTEISKLYGYLCISAGISILRTGDRAEAIRYLRLAHTHMGGALIPFALLWISRISPTTRIASKLASIVDRAQRAWERLD